MTDDAADQRREAIEREVVVLRQRVNELQRRMARYSEATGPDGLRVSISEREELLVEAERIAHMGSWVWDVEHNTVSWSDELFRILGYQPHLDKASVDNFFAAVHPDDVQRVQEASQRGIRSGIVEQTEHRVRHKDGTVRHVRMDASYVFDATEKLRRVVGTVLDVTDTRETASQLREANAALAEAQTLAHLGSWSNDFIKKTRSWSAEFYRILAIDPSADPGFETLVTRLHPDDRDRLHAMYADLLQFGTEIVEDARIVLPDGCLRHVRFTGTGQRDRAGQLVGIRGTMLDVTDLTLLQQRVAHAEKLETIGRLAGGIAHDFNNIMTVIQSGTDLLDATDPQVSTDITQAVASARNLTARLLAFGRQSNLNLQRTDPNQVVRDTVQLVARILGGHVTIRTELDPQIPPATLDAHLTGQALINLVINARDAMPQGGNILLSTRKLESNKGATQVEFSVRDDGHGIDERIRDKIFEPFFTTKHDGHGAGLGLAMVQGAVEQQGGSVHVDSGPTGTCFSLRFLAASARPSASPSMRPSRTPTPMSGLNIMVVEDQQRVLNVVSKVLTRAGHQVKAASLPSIAIEIFRQHAAGIDLILCDLIMPEMFGTTLIERLSTMGPLPRVLFMSGYGADAARDIGPGRILVSKPFTAEELFDAISRTMSA